jgi:hypothetical protein
MFANFLTTRGYPARRGQQFSGSPDSPDVICEDLGYLHWEIKFVQKLNIHKAMQQAMQDCGQKYPVVAHKRKREPWLVTLTAEDFIKLLEK